MQFKYKHFKSHVHLQETKPEISNLPSLTQVEQLWLPQEYPAFGSILEHHLKHLLNLLLLDHCHLSSSKSLQLH
ncbi:unnamed protein product, partial [Vitis vinifera]|uniref:Uncharacterized protein n=1 Tax=Vitis vinifera TaxID=29760 RepID=D7SZ14_VITVI